MKISEERKAELIALVEGEINSRDWFGYHDWDGFIECDEAMTEQELAWLDENYTVEIKLVQK